MSKNLQTKNQQEETTTNLSKKELYDLNKQKKQLEKEKQKKKSNSTKKKKKKTYQTSLMGRIFAFIMLILMVGFIIATVAVYV